MSAGSSLSLGHQTHSWIGRAMVTTTTGRTNILRAICPELAASAPPMTLRPGTGPPVAWLAPPGRTEWTTTPDAIQEIQP